MKTNQIVVDEINSNKVALGIQGKREDAEQYFNRMLNYGAIAPDTELREVNPNFHFFTMAKSKLFAYYVMVFAQRFTGTYRFKNSKGRKGGLVEMAKARAKILIDGLKRETFADAFQTNKDYAIQYHNLGFHNDNAGGEE